MRDGAPILPTDEHRFLAFAVSCALGLGSCLLSFTVRRALEAGTGGGENTKAVLFGLGMAEVPAVLGLVYFILFAEWSGFLLLLGASFVAFLAHATRSGEMPTNDTNRQE